MWLPGKNKRTTSEQNRISQKGIRRTALALTSGLLLAAAVPEIIGAQTSDPNSENLAGLFSPHSTGEDTIVFLNDEMDDSPVNESPIEEAPVNTSAEEMEPAAAGTAEDDEWYLILVNRTHPIPENYQVDLMQLSNGMQVDVRIYPQLQAMFDDARAAGLSLFVRDGYRTQEEQQAIMDGKIEEYKNSGYSEDEAVKLAEEWVALPGTSEHQLGISVDINADNTGSSDDEVYSWLYDNAWKYGFIKRYPEDKTDITGVINEPWHYRYVGEEAAKEIWESGVCLEEYLG